MHIFIKKINLTVYHANFTSGTSKFKIEDVGLFKDGNFFGAVPAHCHKTNKMLSRALYTACNGARLHFTGLSYRF